MKHAKTAVLAAALVAVSVGSYAQGVDIGKREYANSCAVCHGDSGRGDGPIVGYLKAAPTDLTIIEKNNKGVFPFGRVYDVIYGRTVIPAHGPRVLLAYRQCKCGDRPTRIVFVEFPLLS
jgi:cytochrome c